MYDLRIHCLKLENVEHCGDEPDIQFKFSVYGHTYVHKQACTRILKCSPASMGLAQAPPKYLPSSQQHVVVTACCNKKTVFLWNHEPPLP